MAVCLQVNAVGLLKLLEDAHLSDDATMCTASEWCVANHVTELTALCEGNMLDELLLKLKASSRQKQRLRGMLLPTSSMAGQITDRSHLTSSGTGRAAGPQPMTMGQQVSPPPPPTAWPAPQI